MQHVVYAHRASSRLSLSADGEAADMEGLGGFSVFRLTSLGDLVCMSCGGALGNGADTVELAAGAAPRRGGLPCPRVGVISECVPR